MKTIDVTESNFSKVTDNGVVLLDMWASWCGPCRSFGPVFESAAERHPDVVFGKIDTESQPALAQSFGVRAIPTVVAMRDGIVVYCQPGAMQEEGIDELISKVKELDMNEIRSKIEENKCSSSKCGGCGHG